MNTRLFDLAKTIRSKNAGVDRITFDVIFSDPANYNRVRRSGALSRDAICRIFGIAPDRITDCVEFDPAQPRLFAQPFGQRALTRPRGSDDDDAPHPSNLRPTVAPNLRPS